ncbi:MAG: flagellar protein FlgN [Christensenellaceae bacterium]|jgi:hypothetical protein
MIIRTIEILEKLRALHEEIYALSEVKREHIIAGDAQALSEDVKKEWELLRQAAELEDQRSRITTDFARANGLDEKSVTIYDVAQAAGEEQKAQLEKTAGELRDILYKQKQINEENRGLIELHLEYTDFMTNTFLKDPQISNIYGNSGAEIDPDNGKGIIDNKV